MFDSVRKHQRILLFVVILLIFPAFAFFGIQGYDRFLSGGDDVAQVNGEPVTRGEFEQAHREQLERMRQMLGGAVDTQLIDTPQLRAQVLDNLIVQKVMAQHAKESRIAISDVRLREAIRSIPGLVGADGRFDMERYRSLVNARGRSEAGYEAEMRRDLALQALPDALYDSSWVPAAVSDRLYQILGEKRVVHEVRIDPARLASGVNPTEAQLKAHFDQRAEQYQQPESLSVQYVVLDAQGLAERAEVRASEVESFYEQNKARYATPEERRASHILVQVDSKASASDREAARVKASGLLEKIKAGEDFAALAKTASDDPGSAPQGGDLGFFTRELMVKPFADAAFQMKSGEVRGLIETEFGLHIIRLTDIREGKIRPLEDVRAEITASLKREIASRQLAESADTFTNMVYEQPDSLDPVVERFGLKLQTQGDLSRAGAAALGRDHPLNQPKVLAALFKEDAIRDRRNIEAIDLGGRIVSARVVEHRPARQRSLDDVRDEVRVAVIREQAVRLAQERGQALLAAMQAARSDEALSTAVQSAIDGPLPEAKALSRLEPGELDAQALSAIFKASTAKLPIHLGVDLGDGGYAVYRLTQVRAADPSQIEEIRKASAESVQRALAEQDLRDYLESRKAASEITRTLSRINPQRP
jgi:peptidyl-prolyl cis-trans isomerase D